MCAIASQNHRVEMDELVARASLQTLLATLATVCDTKEPCGVMQWCSEQHTSGKTPWYAWKVMPAMEMLSSVIGAAHCAKCLACPVQAAPTG